MTLIHHAAASCIKSHLYEKETCNRKTACSSGSGTNRRGGHRSHAAAGGGGGAQSNFVQSSRGFVSVLDFGLSFPSEKIMVLIFFHFFLFFSHPYAGLKHPKWTVSWGSIYENPEI